MKRGRNQRRRQGGGSNPNRALDSNGPDVRIRGTATQIYDKYQALARDAASSGDRVKAESYLQHAEHYFRVIRSMQPAQAPNQQPGGHDSDSEQPSVDDGEQDQQREARQPREQRNQRNNADDDSNSGEETSPAAAEANNAEPEEERKPRRRRAPRRAAKSEDDAKPEEATPAAAE